MTKQNLHNRALDELHQLDQCQTREDVEQYVTDNLGDLKSLLEHLVYYFGKELAKDARQGEAA